jgi:hypothetical protein
MLKQSVSSKIIKKRRVRIIHVTDALTVFVTVINTLLLLIFYCRISFPHCTTLYLFAYLVLYTFMPHYGPRVDSASNRNEYQEYFLGVKVAGA